MTAWVNPTATRYEFAANVVGRRDCRGHIGENRRVANVEWGEVPSLTVGGCIAQCGSTLLWSNVVSEVGPHHVAETTVVAWVNRCCWSGGHERRQWIVPPRTVRRCCHRAVVRRQC